MREDWALVRLTDLAAQRGLVGGPFGSSLGRKDYRSAGVPVIRGANLSNRGVVGGDFVYVSEEKADQLGGNLAVPGDVVATQRGTLGQAALVPSGPFDRYVVSQSQMRLRVDSSKALAQYVVMALGSREVLTTIEDRKIATANPHINLGIFGELELPLPPLDQQHRIVGLLESTDDAVAAADDARRACEAAIGAASADLIQWTSDLIPLGDVATIVGTLVDPTTAETRGLPHVGVERIVSRHGDLLPLATAADDGVTSGKYLFTTADVIYSKIRPELRKVALPSCDGLCSADAYPLRAGNRMTKEYLFEVLLSDDFVERAVAKSGRTKMPKINRKELFSIEVPAPPLADQARATGVLSDLREVRRRLLVQIDALAAARNALLTDLLSGIHRIPDSFDDILQSS